MKKANWDKLYARLLNDEEDFLSYNSDIKYHIINYGRELYKQLFDVPNF